MPRDHPPAKSLRVLISPPDPALAVLLGLQPDIEVVHSLYSRPQVALADSVEAAAALLAEDPDCRALVMTGSAHPGLLQAALAAGAAGLVLRDVPVEDLARSLRDASMGETVIDPVLRP
ncbi:DNA-binding response regulator [Streptomyces sp. NPDC046866]|uniref:DNA-binding response regulator n=1 Tax=Streptomyces sp. NPDC046866 TaxID=3154921 RepID=UPI003456C12C